MAHNSASKGRFRKIKTQRIVSGVNNINVKATGEIGIAVFNNPGYETDEVANNKLHIQALLLAGQYCEGRHKKLLDK